MQLLDGVCSSCGPSPSLRLVMSKSRLWLLPRSSFFPLATDPGDLWLYIWTSVFFLESAVFIVLRVVGHGWAQHCLTATELQPWKRCSSRHLFAIKRHTLGNWRGFPFSTHLTEEKKYILKKFLQPTCSLLARKCLWGLNTSPHEPQYDSAGCGARL